MSNDATITQAEHEAVVAKHAKKIAQLEKHVDLLKNALYGRSSEKLPFFPQASFQSLLFSDQEVSFPEETDEDSSKSTAPPKKRGRKPRFGPDVEREIVDLELSEAERECSGCGKQMSSIGFESAERAHHVPAKIVVREERRHKYACSCKAGGVTTTPTAPTLFPKTRVTDETRAQVIVSKFVDHCPYYRQSAILRRLGYEISDATLGRMAIEAADRLAPIIVAMHEELLDSEVLQADETRIPVLKTEKQKPGAHCGWLWAYGIPRGTIVYDFTKTRAAIHPSGFLAAYEGILQEDRYEGYSPIRQKPGIIDIACWAHARRRFVEAERTSGRKVRPILALIQRLYAVERKAREAEMPPDERSSLRRKDSVPILDEIHAALSELAVEVRPASALGDAVLYTLKHWAALTLYVEHGLAEIDNNLIENSMRPIALGRKNWIFAGAELGAEAAAILYSLTETCRRLGINPLAYLIEVFRRLPTIDPRDGDAIRALTPARLKAEQAANLS